MLLGPYHIQIFSLMLILCAAIIALMCDFLKRDNEQLRELALELKVRSEEERKHFQMLAPQTAGATPAVSQKAGKAVSQTAAKPLAKPVAAPAARALAAPGEKKRTLAPEALAAIQRGAQMAGAPRTRQPRVEPALVEVVPPVKVISPIEIISSAEVISRVAAAPAASARVAPRIRIRVPASAQQPALPAGFQDGYVLTRLVESHQPVSGLVVSIGVSAPNDEQGSLRANLRTLIQSLIGPNDFAAQSGEEEFLLIYPGERGAAAQGRLSEVAQQLRNFQLGSQGSYSILFSWGGVEVRSESIKEAIASATERMQETRRGRNVLTMESRPASEVPVRRAV